MEAIQILSQDPNLKVGNRPGDWKVNTEPYPIHLLEKVTETFAAKVWRFLALPFTWICRLFCSRRINWSLDWKARDLFANIHANFKKIPEKDIKDKARVWNAVRLNLDKFDKLNVSHGTKVQLHNLKAALSKAVSDLTMTAEQEKKQAEELKKQAELKQKNAAATMIQALTRGFVKKHQFPALKVELKAEKAKLALQVDAATTLQTAFRVHAAKKQLAALKLIKVQNGAATTLQKIIRGHQTRTRLADEKFKNGVNTLFELVIASAKAKQPLAPAVLANAETLLAYALDHKEHETAAWLVTILGQKAKAQLILYPKDKFHNWLRKLADHHPQDGTIAKKDLDLYALELGCGYKMANLMVMKGKVKAIAPKLKHCKLDVPPPVPLYDAQTWQYLSKHIPNLKELFTQFLNSFDKDAKQQFLQAKTSEDARKITLYPSAKGKEILKEIREKIIDAYVKSPFLSPIINQWLKLNECDFVIVRSTGREDSETNSNAGGNASIPNVRPNAAAISVAIGEVVSSYFGETSITQRLQAGDQSIFKEEPFLPVLIQRMICEKNVAGVGSNKRADIPRSGVLFTSEHGKAEGVTVVNAAYGSNEGVVTSMVAVNTFEVHTGGVYSTVRNQPTRFVHLVDKDKPGKFAVGPIENHPEVSGKAVLNKAELQDLKIVADTYATLYGDGKVKPMDMEFGLLMDAEGETTIYLFQIRPLLKPAAVIAPPSFLDLSSVKKVAKEDRETATVFMAGSPNVRMITAPAKQIIFAEDLPGALSKFEKHPCVQELQLIVIKKPAAVTSHPAVVLRPTNIPIFVASDADQWHKIQTLLQGATTQTPALACPQRGMVAKPGNKQLVKPGLVSYPCPLELSLPRRHYSGMFNEETRNEAKTQFLKMVEKTAQEWCPKEFMTHPSLEDLFDMMALSDAPAATLALGQIFRHLVQATFDVAQSAKKDKANLNKQRLADDLFEVLHYAFKIAKNNVLPALKQHGPQAMDRLLHLKKLSALIFQPASNDVCESHSFKTVFEGWQMESNSLSKDFKALGIPSTPENTYLLTLKHFALNETAKEKWLKLVKGLSPADKGKLIPMLKKLVEINVFIPWVNIIFIKTGSNSEVFQSIAQCDNILNQVAQRFMKVKQLENQIPSWEQPSFVEKTIKTHVALFQKELGLEGDIKNLYNGTNPLGKFAILNLLQFSLIKYDEVIKAVTGSKHYKDKREQARHVHALLCGYTSFLKAATAIAATEERAFFGGGGYGGSMTFTTYMSALENGRSYRFGFHESHTSLGLKQIGDKLSGGILFSMSEKDADETLKARPIFNVSAIAIGSHADLNFSAHWPTTLEEHFTTIHQSSDTIFRHLQTKLGFDGTVLPKHITAFTDKITASFGAIADIVVQEKTVAVRYQMALRQHAASLIITAGNEPNTPVQITVSAFGNEEHDRWKQTAFFSALMVNRLGLKYANNARPSIDYRDPKGVEFTVEIPVDHPANRTALYTQLASMLHTLLFSTSMADSMGGTRLANELARHAQYKPLALADKSGWVDLSPETHEQSFFMGLYAMQQARGANNYPVLVAIAEKTLLGMKNYELKDYDADFRPTWLDDCAADGSLGYFKVSAGAKVSTSRAIFAALVIAAKNDPSVILQVRKILTDKTIAEHFPADTNEALKHIMDPKQRFELLVQKGVVHDLLAFAYASGNLQWEATAQQSFLKNAEKYPGTIPDMILKFALMAPQDAFQKTLEMLLKTAHQRGVLETVAIQLCTWYEANNKEPMNVRKKVVTLLEWIKTSKLAPSTTATIDAIFAKEGRKSYLTDITENFGELYKNFGVPSTEESEINLAMYARNVFVGLVQTPDPLSVSTGIGSITTGNNKHVAPYLGSPKYQYFPNNQHTDTTKLHKIAAFTLLRALESPKLWQWGQKALDEIIADFHYNGHKDPGAAVIKPILFALTYAYLRSVEFHEIAAITRHLWGRQRNTFTEFYKYVQGLDADKKVLPHLTLKMEPFPLQSFNAGYGIFTGPAPRFDVDNVEFTKNKIKTVIVLLEKDKMDKFELTEFYAKQGIAVVHHPIVDFEAPPSLPGVDKLTDEILANTKKNNTYVHCMQGQGRTGTIMACLTAKLNPEWPWEKVFQETRKIIPGAMERKGQEEFVKQFIDYLKHKGD